MANETHKLLITLTTLFDKFSYICFTVQWQYSTHARTHTHYVLPPSWRTSPLFHHILLPG